MEHFFTACGITNVGKKTVLFSTNIVPARYKLLCNLVAPVKLEEKLFDELVDTMRQHKMAISKVNHHILLIARLYCDGKLQARKTNISTFYGLSDDLYVT